MAKLDDFNEELNNNTIGEIINSTPSSVEQTRSTRLFVWNWLHTRTTRHKWPRWTRPSRFSTRSSTQRSTSTRRTRSPYTHTTTTTTTTPRPVNQSEEYEMYIEEYSYPVGETEYYENDPIEYYEEYDEILTKNDNSTKPSVLTPNVTNHIH